MTYIPSEKILENYSDTSSILQKISMPGVFGGLMRYDEEYSSRFMISPAQVIAFLVIIVLAVIGLRMFWPSA